MKNVTQSSTVEKVTAITNVRIFDGEKLLSPEMLSSMGKPLFR